MSRRSTWTPTGGDADRLFALGPLYTNPRNLEARLDDDDNVRALRAVFTHPKGETLVTARLNKRSTVLSFQRLARAALEASAPLGGGEES
jgi:hypothetical protein